MQVRDHGDTDQIYAVTIIIVNYKYILKVEPTKFVAKLNGKCLQRKMSKILQDFGLNHWYTLIANNS